MSFFLRWHWKREECRVFVGNIFHLKMCQGAMPLGRGVAFSTLFLELDELRKNIMETLEFALM